MTNYTIIIPHKNIPALLQRCLDSIPSRSDLQIIVVDDNSDPEVVDFDHFPGLGREDVEVVLTKEGKGAGYARNVGMKHAAGKWLLFADADDYYIEGFLSVLDRWKDRDYDIVNFKLSCVDCSGKGIPDFRGSFKRKYRSSTRVLFGIDGWELWSKMFRRSLIVENGFECEETFAANDTSFCVNCGMASQKTAWCRDLIYCYSVRRAGSISQQQSAPYLFARMEVQGRLNKKVREIDKSFSYYKESGFTPLFPFVRQSASIGVREFLHALFLYFKYECFNTIVKDIKYFAVRIPRLFH